MHGRVCGGEQVEQPRHGAGVHEAHPVEEVALREHAACAPRASPFLCSSGWPRIASRRGPPRRAECRPPATGPKGASVRLTTHRCLLPLCSWSIDRLHLVVSLPHVSLRDLAARHGRDGLILLRLAAVSTLVVSSPLTTDQREGRRACLHARDDEPASLLRPAERPGLSCAGFGDVQRQGDAQTRRIGCRQAC